MNYKVKALRVFSINGQTQIEYYEKNCLNYSEAVKEENRLKSEGNYTNIIISKIKEHIHQS